jgi:hypothetical protein
MTQSVVDAGASPASEGLDVIERSSPGAGGSIGKHHAARSPPTTRKRRTRC